MQRTTTRIAAALLVSTLAVGGLTGCGTETLTTALDQQAETVEATTTDDAEEAEAVEEADEAETVEEAEAAEATEDETDSFYFSSALDENGYWQDVTALDYVTLPDDYAALTVPASAVEITDEDVEEQVSSLLSSYATTETVTDRAIVDGDTVNIDYVGTIDGVEFSGGNTGGTGTDVTIGVTNYIDDFLDQLIGHEPGEEVSVEVTFPEDYGNEELNGKDAVFAVTINYITETVTPELTDEFVAENLADTYGWTTADEVRESLKEMLYESALESYVQEAIVEAAQISEVPSVISDYQESLLVYQYQMYADMFGTDLETILSMFAGVSTTDELIAANQDALDQTNRAYLVFQAIAEAEGIVPTDDDVTAYIQLNTGSDDTSTYIDYYGAPYLKLGVIIDNVTTLLTSGVVIDETA